MAMNAMPVTTKAGPSFEERLPKPVKVAWKKLEAEGAGSGVG